MLVITTNITSTKSNLHGWWQWQCKTMFVWWCCQETKGCLVCPHVLKNHCSNGEEASFLCLQTCMWNVVALKKHRMYLIAFKTEM